jgi:hypothetical protein
MRPLLEILDGLFRRTKNESDTRQARKVKLGPALRVRFVESHPGADSVRNDELVIVGSRRFVKWALFRCPCSCRELISLPLMKPQYPRWRLRVERDGAVTLSPSIWRTTSCYSHFWVDHSQISWCFDTGTSPHDHRFSRDE